MELLFAISIAVLVGAAIYLLLRARTYPVILGITLLSYAVNLFLFASGRLTRDRAPITSLKLEQYPDPLPQALVLTAIVIGFGMTALLVALSVRAVADFGNDHVDGGPGPGDKGEAKGDSP